MLAQPGRGLAQPGHGKISPNRQAASVPVLVNCQGGHDVRPEHFVLACGDGDTWLGHMSWQRWGTTAAGQGTLAIDDCVPDCAQGTYHHFPDGTTYCIPSPNTIEMYPGSADLP
jgi:hypothetical protein